MLNFIENFLFKIDFKIIKYDWRIYAKNRKEKVKLKT